MKYIKKLEKIAKQEYVKKNYSLENIKKALLFLGQPQEKLKNIIHITGSNGKGSITHYISAFLHFSGYKVGTYISPHIYTVNERISFNLKPISNYHLEKYLGKVFLYPEINKLTFFELLTCTMFLYFSDFEPDFTVLEVGLGGKLDATNVISRSAISVITSIALEHTEVLGKTELKIVKDKSKIIKENSVCICGDVSPKVKEYLKLFCKKLNTELIFVKNNVKDVKYDFSSWNTEFKIKLNNKEQKLSIPLCSVIQPYNVLLTVEIIKKLYDMKLIRNINVENIKKSVSLPLPARMQKITFDSKRGKTFIIDGAHNPASIKNFVSTLSLSKENDLVICFTMMKEKDYKTSLKIFSTLAPRIAKFCVYHLGLQREQDVNILYKEAKKYFKESTLKFSTLEELSNYIQNFNKTYFVGTFYLMSELKKLGINLR